MVGDDYNKRVYKVVVDDYNKRVYKVVGDDHNKGCTRWLVMIITKGVQGGW